jgi:hypothetical protein
MPSVRRSANVTVPAGFLIYTIENQVPIPTSFLTTRKLREREALAEEQQATQAREFENRIAYDAWIEEQIDQELDRRYPGAALNKKIKEVVAQRVRTDERFGKMLSQPQEAISLQFLRRDVQDEVGLLSFNEWCQQKHQLALF